MSMAIPQCVTGSESVKEIKDADLFFAQVAKTLARYEAIAELLVDKLSRFVDMRPKEKRELSEVPGCSYGSEYFSDLSLKIQGLNTTAEMLENLHRDLCI